METPQRLSFTVSSGQPLTVEVTALDGKKHVVLVGVVVFDVLDTGEKDPKTGDPVFKLKAGLAVEAVKNDSESQK